MIFQSTPPVKAATDFSDSFADNSEISIHAAREGGDADNARADLSRPDFNPRRP